MNSRMMAEVFFVLHFILWMLPGGWGLESLYRLSKRKRLRAFCFRASPVWLERLGLLGGSAARFFVFLHGARKESFEVFDAVTMRRVSGEEFGRLTAAGFVHSLPEGDAFAGVVTGASHVDEAHFIGFAFVRAAKGKEDAVLCAGTEEAHNGLALLIIHIAHGIGSADEGGLGDGILEDALRTMPGDRVGDFMAQNRRETGFVFGDGKDAGVNDDFAARQTECVHLRAIDESDFPIEISASVAG